MSDREEWGPWIEHDGKSKPADGTVVHVVYATGTEMVRCVGVTKSGIAKTRRQLNYWGPTYASAWLWAEPGRCAPIVRYRIRKPRGLTLLEDLIADLPAPVQPEGVPA